jgi:hypothetical protein
LVPIKNSPANTSNKINTNLNKMLKNPKSSEEQNNPIGPYLAGIWEGDGHISSVNITKNNKKESFPYLAITFSSKDEPLSF